MADVGPDRGQLILVTGLMVAVAMVALVLLLNTAIYTENLASRGIDQSGREAVEFRAEVVDGVGGLIDEENAANDEDYGTLEDRVEQGIDTIDELTARRNAYVGSSAAIDESTTTLTPGWTIRQTEPTRSFTNESGTADWTLVTGVSSARSVTITLDDSSLVDTTAGSARSAGAFSVNVTAGSSWEVFIYDDGGVTIAISVDGNTPVEACSRSEPSATIDLTRGTVDGDRCAGLDWAEGVGGGYAITYANGTAANGTYSITLDSPQPEASNLNDATSTTASPYFAPAVYSATLELRFESPTVTYEETVYVAPGEPS